jgi:DNA repair photolyase
MRWDNLRLDSGETGDDTGPGWQAPPLIERGAVVRTFDTPEFRGMTFYEIHAKSIVSRVPATSNMPFTWTINPYRGCSHACKYCFARNTHSYLDLDAGKDFDTKVVVKVNAPELLRAKLASPRWGGEHIAMGTNVDCYQRVEGRYQLMRGIIGALRDAANPFSILTKGTLILRDLDLLLEAAEVTDVGLNVSAAFVDKSLWRAIEPGTPAPERRLEACATLNDAGLRCGVLMGPVVPYLSDSPAQLEAAVRMAAEAGAPQVMPIVLHLRPGAREWFLGWLGQAHPELVPRYAELYGRGSYARKDYQARINGQVRELAERYGVGRRSGRQDHAGPRWRGGPAPGRAEVRAADARRAGTRRADGTAGDGPAGDAGAGGSRQDSAGPGAPGEQLTLL